ncbi:DUF7674 family protein [Actinoplanes couchii]|uniref:DUF7674 family protein n=1 Tax=Actinoplanes couchii TaxID=403638 RepID=UPI00403A279A
MLPEARDLILQEEDGEYVGTYTYMSVFRHVLDDAARRGDLVLVRRCLTILELLIADGDHMVQSAAQIRVLDKDGLTTELPFFYRAYAGPLTRRGLGYRDEDLTYLPPDWPVTLRPVPDGRPDVTAQVARAWLCEWSAEARAWIIDAERAELGPDLSLAGMTADRYFAAALHGLLDHATERAAAGDPDPVDDVMALLTAMVADPGLAGLVHDRRDELAGCLVLQIYAGRRISELERGTGNDHG